MPKDAISDADLARAERIRSKREACGMNQSELGRAMRPPVAPQTVQQWEKGGGIRGKYQQQLAKVLRVTPEWLMFGVLNEPENNSPHHDVGHARAVRLTGETVATALTAIEWRLQLVDMEMKYDPSAAPDVLASALTWALDQSAENLAALQSSLQAEIQRQEREKRHAASKDRPGAAGEADHGHRAKPAGGRRK